MMCTPRMLTIRQHKFANLASAAAEHHTSTTYKLVASVGDSKDERVERQTDRRVS